MIICSNFSLHLSSQSYFYLHARLISRASGITDLSIVRHRPSVNFCFQLLLLLQFLFDHSEFFTRETRHILLTCNKAVIYNFCLEFKEFTFASNCYSFSSCSIILVFPLEKLGVWCHPVTTPEFMYILRIITIECTAKFFSGVLFGQQVSLFKISRTHFTVRGGR